MEARGHHAAAARPDWTRRPRHPVRRHRRRVGMPPRYSRDIADTQRIISSNQLIIDSNQHVINMLISAWRRRTCGRSRRRWTSCSTCRWEQARLRRDYREIITRSYRDDHEIMPRCHEAGVLTIQAPPPGVSTRLTSSNCRGPRAKRPSATRQITSPASSPSSARDLSAIISAITFNRRDLPCSRRRHQRVISRLYYLGDYF